MTYLINKGNDNEDVQAFLGRFNNYFEYLHSIKDQLPASAYMFATSEWHYNHEDPKCPHDAWLEHITISEPSSGGRRQVRSTEILVVLLGAFHNGYIEIRYKQVNRYTVTLLPARDNRGYGDWLLDEIHLSENGLVVHEIVFVHGRWLIECEDIVYKWKPFSTVAK